MLPPGVSPGGRRARCCGSAQVAAADKSDKVLAAVSKEAIDKLMALKARVAQGESGCAPRPRPCAAIMAHTLLADARGSRLNLWLRCRAPAAGNGTSWQQHLVRTVQSFTRLCMRASVGAAVAFCPLHLSYHAG